jgi:hypothetical protein
MKIKKRKKEKNHNEKKKTPQLGLKSEIENKKS